MTKLIEATQKYFGGEIKTGGLVFSFGEDDFHLTDEGRIYEMVDGGLCGTGQKVKSLLSVENFVAERAE